MVFKIKYKNLAILNNLKVLETNIKSKIIIMIYKMLG